MKLTKNEVDEIEAAIERSIAIRGVMMSCDTCESKGKSDEHECGDCCVKYFYSMYTLSTEYAAAVAKWITFDITKVLAGIVDKKVAEDIAAQWKTGFIIEDKGGNRIQISTDDGIVALPHEPHVFLSAFSDVGKTPEWDPGVLTTASEIVEDDDDV